MRTLVAWLLLVSSALAQDATVSLAQDGLAHPAGLGKVRVSVAGSGAPGVLGASLPILFDSAALEPISAFPIGTLLDTNSGAGPDFFNWVPRDEGMLVGYITQLIPPASTLQAPGEVVQVVFFVKPTQAGATIPLLIEEVPGLSPPMGYDVILQLADLSAFEVPVLPATSQLLVSNQFSFVRGDANQNGAIDLVDAVRTLEVMFLGATAECTAAVDANDSGDLTLVDTMTVLDYLFASGTPLPEPTTECGGDQTGLDCNETVCP